VKIQWVIMAEGITTDARGALAAVGLGQSAIIVPAVPAQAKRAVIAQISGEKDELYPGLPVSFSVSVLDPSGKALSVNSGQVPIGPMPFPDMPLGLNLASEVMFMISNYGRHVIRVAAQVSDAPEMATEVEFYATQPPLDLGATSSGNPAPAQSI